MLRIIRLALVPALLVSLGLTACSDKMPPATWVKVEPPKVSTETDDITVNEGTLSDGTYWAEIAPVSGSGDIVFRVLKARFGETCLKWAKDMGLEDGCLNDYNVESYPVAYVALDEMADVTVTKPDGPGTGYSINADVLKGLVRGNITDAPDNYSWVPFPFVVTVTNGYVTTADQYWVP